MMRLSEMRLSSAVVLCVFLAGCADLSAIRDFSKTSADSASFTGIVENYAESPDTQLIYLYPEKRKAGEESHLRELKRISHEQAKELLNVLAAVTTYMSAIGNLAADKAADPTENVNQLISELDSAKIIGTDLSKPASAVASLVGKMVMDGYRQKDLRRAIRDANPQLQKIRQNLDILLNEKTGGFSLSLRAECTAISDYYDYWHNVAADHNEPAAAEILAFRKRAEIAAYGKNCKSADGLKFRDLANYQAVFDEIANGHQALFDNQGDLANKALLATIKNYAMEIRSTMATIKASKP